jgi:hypothetical protein
MVLARPLLLLVAPRPASLVAAARAARLDVGRPVNGGATLLAFRPAVRVNGARCGRGDEAGGEDASDRSLHGCMLA